jgi:hypothetical protein
LNHYEYLTYSNLYAILIFTIPARREIHLRNVPLDVEVGQINAATNSAFEAGLPLRVGYEDAFSRSRIGVDYNPALVSYYPRGKVSPRVLDMIPVMPDHKIKSFARNNILNNFVVTGNKFFTAVEKLGDAENYPYLKYRHLQRNLRSDEYPYTYEGWLRADRLAGLISDVQASRFEHSFQPVHVDFLIACARGLTDRSVNVIIAE